jgi:hypothetical protein
MQIRIMGWLLIIGAAFGAVGTAIGVCIGDVHQEPVRTIGLAVISVLFGWTGWQLIKIPLPQK